jgi:geranylgeranyl reductase family protein
MSAGVELWDVAIVGAGPAGSATAARLAERGWRVVLLDRADFPRAKPCGECINPAAVEELDRLGALAAVRAAGAAELAGWRIESPAGTRFGGDFPAGVAALAMPRARLDAVLLAHAAARGAEVRTGEPVRELIYDAGRVAGVRVGRGRRTRELRARLVVGADGLRSVVARRLGLVARAPKLRKLALTAHVRGISGLDGRGELHVRRWGCIGVAPVGEGVANAVVVLNEAHRGAATGRPAECFDEALAAEPRLAGAERTTEVLATGPFDWAMRSAVADGALVVGDAAGYFDPFTGEGIGRALHGAELAATAIDGALRSGDVSARTLAPYTRALRSAFAPGLRLQRLIELAVARPALMDLAAHRLARRPALGAALVAATGGVRPVRSLFSPILLVQWVA